MPKRALLSLVLGLILFFTFSHTPPGLASESQPLDISILEEIIADVNLYYIEDPDQDALIRGAIEGLLNSLRDPYTVYLSPEEYKYFISAVEGDYVGIGVQIQPGEDYPMVVDTFEDSPARAAGIKPGDLVIKVDGTDISRDPLAEVVEKMTGQEGTAVRVTIRREGMADIDLEMIRANIAAPTVSSEIVDGDIGLIRIGMFGDSTKEEFKKSLNDLISRGAKSLVLDLRGTPGGMLASAVDIVGNFTAPGQLVVSTVDRNGQREEYLTGGEPVAKGMPVVVMLDENSASASEALAGALQDYGLATLIGGRTYGKGTIQMLIPLRVGGALKITSARYYTPKGRVIDGTGLSPDIQILDPYLPQAVAQRYLKNAATNTITLDAAETGSRVNGLEIKSGRVIEQEGAFYLPLRLMFEALGYRVDCQPADGTIKVTGFEKEALFHTSDGRFTINGQDYVQASSLLAIDGEAFVQDSVFSLFGISEKKEGSKITFEK